jgi:hypothetical protein
VIPVDDRSIALWCRLDSKRRSLPARVCASCGIGLVLVLIVRYGMVLCYGCDALTRGRSGREDHHLGGRPSAFRFRVPANLHRLLSLWQEWTWRGVHSAGSLQAAYLDLDGLLVLGPLYHRAVGPAS